MSEESVSEQLRRRFEEIVAGSPALAALFPRTPSYRYWSIGQRRFCWNTEPLSGDHPWQAFEYAPVGPGSRSGKAKELKMVRCVNCSTRKAAKARALKWYQAAKEKAEPQG